MLSHAVAFGVVLFYIIKIYVHNDLLGIDAIHESDPGTALFVFLLLFLAIEMLVNVRLPV